MRKVHLQWSYISEAPAIARAAAPERYGALVVRFMDRDVLRLFDELERAVYGHERKFRCQSVTMAQVKMKVPRFRHCPLNDAEAEVCCTMFNVV